MADSIATNDFASSIQNPQQGQAFNPSSVLDKDSFLKLMLTQLQYQDPTSPMDTDKMLSQTADMAVIESQENIRKSMEGMVNQFQSTSNYQMIGAVGKMADTGLNAVQFKNGGEQYEDVFHFEEDSDGALFIVRNEEGNVVRQQQIDAEIPKGLNPIAWDGKHNDGQPVEAGTYTLEVRHVGRYSGKEYTSKLGVYPIDSVVLDQKTPRLSVGGEYYTLDEIRAIKERP